jgi:hypothetical protein
MRRIQEVAACNPVAALCLGVGMALFSGCGSDDSNATAGSTRDAGSPAIPGVDAAALASTGNVNPDGFPYPTPAGGYGHSPRKGTTPGSIIQNFKFFGYPNADESKGLQTIALADYYDPCGRRLKLLHLSVAAVWCQPCNQETLALVAAKAQLTSEQVVIVQALSDGPTRSVPATTSDLKFWIQENKSNFTEMLDPNLANFGVFFDAAAVPWNADVDPRTMEIMDDGTGYAGSVSLELQSGISAASKPPDYPIAVQCN